MDPRIPLAALVRVRFALRHRAFAVVVVIVTVAVAVIVAIVVVADIIPSFPSGPICLIKPPPIATRIAKTEKSHFELEFVP